jgi:hypothetical protein
VGEPNRGETMFPPRTPFFKSQRRGLLGEPGVPPGSNHWVSPRLNAGLLGRKTGRGFYTYD